MSKFNPSIFNATSNSVFSPVSTALFDASCNVGFNVPCNNVSCNISFNIGFHVQCWIQCSMQCFIQCQIQSGLAEFAMFDLSIMLELECGCQYIIQVPCHTLGITRHTLEVSLYVNFNFRLVVQKLQRESAHAHNPHQIVHMHSHHFWTTNKNSCIIVTVSEKRGNSAQNVTSYYEPVKFTCHIGNVLAAVDSSTNIFGTE